MPWQSADTHIITYLCLDKGATKMTRRTIFSLEGEQGSVAIIVTISLLLLVGVAALVIDIGHLAVTKNELQNAADAGALAGARCLYNDDGTAINVDCNQTAIDAATANRCDNLPVEVSAGDVERGHWAFATKTFTPNNSTQPVALWNVSKDALDANTNFINAVRVTARRQDTPVTSFFAGMFGHQGFQQSATAVACISFSGNLSPHEVDQPVAICENAITINDEYRCNVGRMVPNQDTNNETAAWTDFNQDDPCSGGTNSPKVKSSICNDGNSEPIILGEKIAVINGLVATAFKKMRNCWASETGMSNPWNMTLPVIECKEGRGGNVRVCADVKGAVNVDVVWITEVGNDPAYKNAPTEMSDFGEYSYWSYPPDPGNTNGQDRWNSFVEHFNLQNDDGSPAPYQKKTIYFVPDCTPHELKGRSGGENYGVLAKIPALVE